MPSQSGHPEYDENLLASAPVATKAQLQSGYNPDLLAEKGTPPSSRNDLEARGRSPVERIDDEHPTPIPPKVPYYRTRKGIITIVVVLVVIIAVAVGGGIAGSKKKTTNTSGALPQTTATNPAASGTGGDTPTNPLSKLLSTTVQFTTSTISSESPTMASSSIETQQTEGPSPTVFPSGELEA